MKACELPSAAKANKKLCEILKRAKTIVVVGLSPKEHRASHQVAKYMQQKGYKIIPVYPREEEILGEKVYRSLKEIPFEVDMVDIFRKAAVVDLVVDQAISMKNIKTIWTQIGIVNNNAVTKAKNAGMNVVQNLCTKIEHKAIY